MATNKISLKYIQKLIMLFAFKGNWVTWVKDRRKTFHCKSGSFEFESCSI